MKFAQFGGVITFLQIINGVLLGLGIYSSGFYKDGLSLDVVSKTVTHGKAKGIVYGVFLAAFINIWVSMGQFCSHVFILWWEKVNSKVNGVIGVCTCCAAFVICVFGHAYIADSLGDEIVKEGLAYYLLVSGTAFLGFTSLLAFAYGYGICSYNGVQYAYTN